MAQAPPLTLDRRAEHVGRTWNMVRNNYDAAVMFYRRLFEIAPETAKLFKGQDDKYLHRQGKRLFDMITRAINMIDDPNRLFSVLEDLGVSHVGYGVRFNDYSKAGAALLWTLEQGLGEEWTPEVKESWITIFGIVRSNMLTGAMKAYEEDEAEKDAKRRKTNNVKLGGVFAAGVAVAVIGLKMACNNGKCD